MPSYTAVLASRVGPSPFAPPSARAATSASRSRTTVDLGFAPPAAQRVGMDSISSERSLPIGGSRATTLVGPSGRGSTGRIGPSRPTTLSTSSTRECVRTFFTINQGHAFGAPQAGAAGCQIVLTWQTSWGQARMVGRRARVIPSSVQPPVVCGRQGYRRALHQACLRARRACRRPGVNHSVGAAWPMRTSSAAVASADRAVLLAPGILSPRKITVKTARSAHVLADGATRQP
jgi:hypothetical protein